MTVRFCLFAICAFALVGCEGGGKPETVPAGGKAMFRKTTVPVGALVVFHPVDPMFEKRIGGKPFAKVGADGAFTLTTYTEGDGAPEGEYGVTIDWRPPTKDAKIAFGEGGASGPSKLNPKYSTPQQPFTKVTVKKGDPNQFTFDVD